MYRARRIHTAFWITCIGIALAAKSEEYRARTLLRLDGANYSLYDQEYPNRSRNMHSIIYGNPLDSFPFQHLRAYGFEPRSGDSMPDTPRLAGAAGLASETGDRLLNSYSASSGNRDHYTLVTAAARLPAVPGYVYSGYRYNDMHTDKFDNMWHGYEERAGVPMDHDNEGLIHEAQGGYAFVKQGFQARGSIAKYGYWGHAPIFFSPIYRAGYKTSHDMRLALTDRTLFASMGFNYHKDYYDHEHGERLQDFSLRAGVRQPLNKRVKGQLALDVNTAVFPSTKFEASVDDSFGTHLTWTAAGGLYNDFHPFAGLALCFTPVSIVSISSEAAWDLVPRERPYLYRNNLRAVDYVPEAYEVLTFHTSVEYADTLLFPVMAAVWYDYCDRPLWERLRYEGGRAVITQDTLGNAATSHIGGKASYEITFRKLLVDLWGNMAITPGGRLRQFYLPHHMGTDVGYGSRRGDRPYAGMRFEHRAAAVFRYYNDEIDRLQELISPKVVGFSFVCRVPFHFPVYPEHIGSCVWIEAGPVHLNKEFLSEPNLENQRIREHPAGSLIGPRVAVRFEGTLR
ncbi:MAG: hypothetical protein GF418_02845 [Chitinivibrionales bacterium]|nr:hypothetical protein [Chitinivibrionales bacterium]MBD3394540.1 hypothetical protein [Chitinivibrionales bacterium]